LFSIVQENVSQILIGITKCLADYLQNVLPLLGENWWSQSVLGSLSYHQLRRLEQDETQELSALDLAALLRVLDQNWYQISMKKNLTNENRHYIKEMQTIRNRWAHATSQGFPAEDIYRDLDTMQRFSIMLKASEELVQKIRSNKTTLLSSNSEILSNKTEPARTMVDDKKDQSALFTQGQIVALRTDPSRRGAVVEILPNEKENRYKLYINDALQTFYESQLCLDGSATEGPIVPIDQFHAHLSAIQILHPSLSTLYSLNAARVDFIPYQFRPVLRFIRSDRPRLLIADSVGVGKTIEAGLILRELQARRDIRSVLIICPRPLVTEKKWQIEMKRFEERFSHLDGKALRDCINEMDKEGVWPEHYLKAILPYSLFDESLLCGSNAKSKGKRKKGLIDLDPPPRFDLVIVDEAHHIRNQDTYTHKAVRFFCEHAEAVLFLSATPIQLGQNDLYVLLNTLRPDLVIDQESFKHMAEPNPFINLAIDFARKQNDSWQTNTLDAVEQAASTAWGQAILKHNPSYIEIHKRLSSSEPMQAEDRIQLISDLENLHTFSGIINRTRRRDIGDFTIRKPETVIVDFTPDQKTLHDDILKVQAEIFQKLHNNNNVAFMMTTIRRQAASCLYGLAPFLEDILNRHMGELLWEEADGNGDLPNNDSVLVIESQIRLILNKARNLDTNDPKLFALMDIIRVKQDTTNNKIMIFSSFRHTLNYIYRSLKEEKYRAGLIHGDTKEEERIEQRERFKSNRDDKNALDIMLFSEIGCEGLDYQFCDCMVNYDLPWNPMRIEQRIGRIDRNGQKSESVSIFNLITPGTVDADIYERCLVRIGVFNHALGGSEEILGDITHQIINIAENFSLSDEERNQKLQQLADNQIRLMQEQEQLEQRQLELFGIRIPENQIRKEIDESSSYWLTSSSIQRLVTLYLQKRIGIEQEFILGDKQLKTLRLSQNARNDLLRDFQSIPKQNIPTYREWDKWLKGDNPHLLITFESECAAENHDAVFLMPLHPLVKQAALAFNANNKITTSLLVQSNDVAPGTYKFAIYKWQFYGVRDDLTFQPIASSADVTAHLNDFLKEAIITTSKEISANDWDDLDAYHYDLWLKARSKHKQHNQELVEYRRESLNASHKARTAILEEQLLEASNEKIQRMKHSQIATAETDYARRLQDLDIALERADVLADPVAYGFLTVEVKS
jgi:superfamily II DNA or RNA helicase